MLGTRILFSLMKGSFRRIDSGKKRLELREEVNNRPLCGEGDAENLSLSSSWRFHDIYSVLEGPLENCSPSKI